MYTKLETRLPSLDIQIYIWISREGIATVYSTYGTELDSNAEQIERILDMKWRA